MTLTAFDMVMAVIVVLSIVHGTLLGFIAEFFSKVAVIAGIIAAVLFYDVLSPHVTRLTGGDTLVDVASFLAIFVIVYLFVKAIQHVAGNAFEGESMTNLDRALGFFLGIAEGLIIVFIVLLAITRQRFFDLSFIVEGSLFAKAFEPLLAASTASFPEYIKTVR